MAYATLTTEGAPGALRGRTAEAWPERLSPAELDLVDAETPFLGIDLGVVQARSRAMQTAFGHLVGLRYAVKCNSAPEVLRALAASGSGFEIASAAELALAVAAGADPATLVYSNPVKPPAHVARAAQAGVGLFVVDGPAEVDKIAEWAPGASVLVRVVVADSSSAFPLSAKFGLAVPDAPALLARARAAGLRPVGMTFHVGSQCTDVRGWARAVDACAPVFAAAVEQGEPLTVLDLGGGFPARYDGGPVPSVDEIALHTLEAVDRLPGAPPRLLAEPGRSLVAEAGVLATTVIGLEDRGDRRWVFLDVGGYNGLMEAAQTGGRWPYPLLASGRSGSLVPCTITGPSCDSSDTVLLDAALPADLQLGDRVYVGSTGAYTTVYAAAFNGFPAPTLRYVG
ncbi:MAG: type III PLP-dependent enzyme [Actinomycetota bacterium]|nr:type III PLP-dependent enzyme [Actinomycetota bacterium]